VNGDFTTSITAQDTEFIHAWPNPCTDILHLAQPFHGELYDSRGAWLRTYSNTSALSVQDLTPGVYLLRSRSGEVTRFVKE
ncbi:MAG: T9SS type A sorting domain-containing protein, partial [Flavobacteriales bacterium]